MLDNKVAGLVAEKEFLIAARESGYHGFVSAIAELVDNSVQAEAATIRIFFRNASVANGIEVAVLDDGVGMNVQELTQALRFGGSTRFDDRTGIGRFGVGLPNSSVSQAKRCDVFSWQQGHSVHYVYLDVDEITTAETPLLPLPKRAALPQWIRAERGESGTLVVWTKCDRISAARLKSLPEKLTIGLGRIYRYAIWNGLAIYVNDSRVAALDPLFLNRDAPLHGATPFGPELCFTLLNPTGGQSPVRVQFSELPVDEWAVWDGKKKRQAGIVGGAGISVVRAGREIDYGWHFFGSKRKENYDDWWRCELRFMPDLDELFGVTTSKQGIRPTHATIELLSKHLETTARILARRVRTKFQSAECRKPTVAQVSANRADKFLPDHGKLGRLTSHSQTYDIRVDRLNSREFFSAEFRDGRLIVVFNSEHPFYKKVYMPACIAKTSRERYIVELMVLAHARTQLDIEPDISEASKIWSDTIAAFLQL